MADTYQTQFTRENVKELNQHIQKSISDFAVAGDRKLDLFVIVASLQQAAYEIALRSLVENKEEAEQKTQAMLPISQAVVSTLDELRAKSNSQPTEELLGAIFGANVIVEFYAHNRDEKITALMEASKVVQDEAVGPQSGEVVDAEIIE